MPYQRLKFKFHHDNRVRWAAGMASRAREIGLKPDSGGVAWITRRPSRVGFPLKCTEAEESRRSRVQIPAGPPSFGFESMVSLLSIFSVGYACFNETRVLVTSQIYMVKLNSEIPVGIS